MTTFNGYTVIDRDNRPSPIAPAKLDFFFVKSGSYIDPFQVCSVHVFPDTQFGSADAYLDLTSGSENYGLVDSGSTDMVFHNQKVSTGSIPPNQILGFDANVSAMRDESYYNASLPMTASGIFKTGPGAFSVILQPGTHYWSPSATDFTVQPPVAENSASGTGSYLDLWTIVDVEGSRAQIYANVFQLTTANVFGSTGPLAVTANNHLIQRYVNVGSKKSLQIKTELVVDNDTITADLRNLMETGALVQNPEISITKINETPGITSRVQVTGNGGVGGFITSGVKLNAHGTMSFLWDTANITTFYGDENLGGPTGVYEVQVRYNLLDETILSPRFKLIVR